MEEDNIMKTILENWRKFTEGLSIKDPRSARAPAGYDEDDREYDYDYDCAYDWEYDCQYDCEYDYDCMILDPRPQNQVPKV